MEKKNFRRNQAELVDQFSPGEVNGLGVILIEVIIPALSGKEELYCVQQFEKHEGRAAL